MTDRLKEIDLEIKDIMIEIMLYGSTIGDYANEVDGVSLKDRTDTIIKTSKYIVIDEDRIKLLKKEKKELMIELMGD